MSVKLQFETVQISETGYDLALARSRAYRVFGELYLGGPSRALLPVLAQIPELDDALRYDADTAAADHYAMFGLNVFPYQGAYLEPDGNLGGPVADSVRAFYRQVGFNSIRLRSESADHIGIELLLMSHLCAAEAEARQDRAAMAVLKVAHWQRRFLDEHLLQWLPALTQAVLMQASPFYNALAELSLELALDHRFSMRDQGGKYVDDPQLPPLPALLDNPKTGLKEISAYLLTPVYSGMYLSRNDINRLAHSLQLPRGFGSRQQMLTNLLQSASDYDLLPALLDLFKKEISAWEDTYRRHMKFSPPIQNITAAWLERLMNTSGILDQLAISGRTALNDTVGELMFILGPEPQTPKSGWQPVELH